MLAEAAAGGITRVVTVGCDLPSSRWAATCAAEHAGRVRRRRHPPERDGRARQPTPRQRATRCWPRSAGWPRGRGSCAVGETGLDYYWDGAAGRAAAGVVPRAHRDRQAAGKALMIHDRDAHDDVLRILAEEGAPEQVVFHCFSGDAAMASGAPRPAT